MEDDHDEISQLTLCSNGSDRNSLSLQLGGSCVRRSKLLSDMLTDCTTTTNLTTPFPPSHIASWMLFSTEHRSPEKAFNAETLCKVLQVASFLQDHDSVTAAATQLVSHIRTKMLAGMTVEPTATDWWKCVSDTADALQRFDTAALHAVVEHFQSAELFTAPRFILRAHLEIQRTHSTHLSLTDYLFPASDAQSASPKHSSVLGALLEEAAVLAFTSIALPRTDPQHLMKALSQIPLCRMEVNQSGVGNAWTKCMPAVTAIDFQFSAPICSSSDAQTVQEALASMPHLQAVTMPYWHTGTEWQLVSDALRPLSALRCIQISQSPCIDLCGAWNSNMRDAWHPIFDVKPLMADLFTACAQLTQFELHLPVARDQVFKLIGSLAMLPQLQHLGFGITPKHSECEATLVRDVEHHLVFLGKLEALTHLEITYWSHACPLKPGDTARFLECLASTLKPLSELRVLQFYVHWQSHQDCLYIDQAPSGAAVAVEQQIGAFTDLAACLDEVVVRGQYCDLLLPFARALKDAQSVRSVCLHDWTSQADSKPYMPQTILDLGCLSSLVHLSLSIQWDVTDAWTKSLAESLGNLKQLQRLELSSKNAFQSCFQGNAAEVVSSIAALSVLQHLSVEFCKPLFEFWDVFCEFKREDSGAEGKCMTASLSHLELSNVGFDMKGSAAVLKQLTSLKHLSIVHNEFHEAQEVSFLTDLTHLQHLAIEVDFQNCERAFEVLGNNIGQLTLTHLAVKFHSCCYCGLSVFVPCLTSLCRLSYLNLCEDETVGHGDLLLSVAETWMEENWKSICSTLQDSWSSTFHIPLLASIAGLRVPIQSLRNHAACLVLFRQRRMMDSASKASSHSSGEVGLDAIIPAYR